MNVRIVFPFPSSVLATPPILLEATMAGVIAPSPRCVVFFFTSIRSHSDAGFSPPFFLAGSVICAGIAPRAISPPIPLQCSTRRSRRRTPRSHPHRHARRPHRRLAYRSPFPFIGLSPPTHLLEATMVGVTAATLYGFLVGFIPPHRPRSRPLDRNLAATHRWSPRRT